MLLNIIRPLMKAYIKMVEAQVQAYKMDKGIFPTSIEELETEGYLKSEESPCPQTGEITIDATGKVTGPGGS
jgi:competence protein ComGC